MIKDILNPAPTSPVRLRSGAFKKQRYSNLSAEGDGTNTSSFDWNEFFSGLFGFGSSIGNGIFGTSDKYTSMAYQNMYNEEKKMTRVMIGIVVALVLLAFAFIILKKK